MKFRSKNNNDPNKTWLKILELTEVYDRKKKTDFSKSIIKGLLLTKTKSNNKTENHRIPNCKTIATEKNF